MKKLTKADIPEGYCYAAVDDGGWAWAYKSKPNIEYYQWNVGKGSDPKHIGSDFDDSDWQNSLVSVED